MQGIAAGEEAAWCLWCALRQRAPPPLLVALLRRLDKHGTLSMDAGQAALLALLQPAAPLLPPDAEHRRWMQRCLSAPPHLHSVHVAVLASVRWQRSRCTAMRGKCEAQLSYCGAFLPARRLLRAVVLAAEADGQEVDERLMQLYSDCLLGQAQPDADTDAGVESSHGQSLLPPPPQPGWCHKVWCYAPAGEAPAASLAAVASLEAAVAERRRAWLASQQPRSQQGQRQQAGALPACPPAATGDGSRGLLALHVSLNLLEGGTGCHEW